MKVRCAAAIDREAWSTETKRRSECAGVGAGAGVCVCVCVVSTHAHLRPGKHPLLDVCHACGGWELTATYCPE